VALSDVVSMLDLGSIGKTVRALDTVMCVDLGGLRASMIVSRDAVRAIDAGAALPGMHERASVSDVARVLVIAEASENVLTSDVGRSGILHLANDAVLATDVGALLLAIIAGRDSGLFEDTAAIVGPRTSGAQESGKAADSGGVKVVVAAADGVRCSDKEFVLITLDPMTDSVNAADSGGVVSWKVEAIDKVKCAEAYGVSPDGIYAVPNDDAGRARETANICVAIGATDAVSCTDKALAPAGPSAEDSVGCADSCSVRVTPGAYATAWS
jgi:hypothetical protein